MKSNSAGSFREILKNLGSFNVIEYSETTRTSQDAANVIGCMLGQIAKSLVFWAGETPVLVMASGSNRVDTGKLSRLTGKEIRMMEPEKVKEITGFSIGGVPPCGHKKHIETLIDEDLLQYEKVYAAAGSPHAVFEIAPQELVRITKGEISDIRRE